MPTAAASTLATGSAAGNAAGNTTAGDEGKAAAAAAAAANVAANVAANGAAASDKAAADAAAATKATADAATAKATADAAAAAAKAAEPVYALKAPEGVEVAKATIDEVTAFAKEHKIAPEVAQKLLEREASARTAITESAQAALRETAEKVWPEQCKADKEIGGAKFVENMAHAKAAIDGLGSPELKKALNETGLGNHPELVRFCVKVGKMMADDKIIPAGNAAKGEVRLADALFGDPPKQE